MKTLLAILFALMTVSVVVECHKGKLSQKNKAQLRKNVGWEKIFGQAKMAGKKVVEKVDDAMRFINEIRSKQEGVIKFLKGIEGKTELSQEEQNTLTKIFVYQQKLDKKIMEFTSQAQSKEKIESLKAIKSQLTSKIQALANKKIEGISESRVRGCLVVLRDYVTLINEQKASEENKKVIKKISKAFDSGEEDELFAIHTYVDEVVKSNQKVNIPAVKLLEDSNEEYFAALHSLKSESSDSTSDLPSIEDLKSKAKALNDIIAKAGKTHIQGVDLEQLKDQLNEAVKQIEAHNKISGIEEEDKDVDLNDNEHYGKLLNKMMGEPKEQAFDNGNTPTDLAEGGKKMVHAIPYSFVQAVKQLALSGVATHIENGIDDYMNFLDKTYDLNDVQKILAKKRKDRVMENLPNLCGKEVMMWVKQELESMLMDFQKAGFHPLQRIEAVKDLNYGLVDADDSIDDHVSLITQRCKNHARRRRF